MLLSQIFPANWNTILHLNMPQTVCHYVSVSDYSICISWSFASWLIKTRYNFMNCKTFCHLIWLPIKCNLSVCKQAVCTRNYTTLVICAWNVGRLLYYNGSTYVVWLLCFKLLFLHACYICCLFIDSFIYYNCSVQMYHAALSILQYSHNSRTTLSKHFGLWLQVIDSFFMG